MSILDSAKTAADIYAWRENFHFITKFSVNFLHSTESVALEKLFAQFPRFLQLKILQIICLRNEVARGVSRRSQLDDFSNQTAINQNVV